MLINKPFLTIPFQIWKNTVNGRKGENGFDFTDFAKEKINFSTSTVRGMYGILYVSTYSTHCTQGLFTAVILTHISLIQPNPGRKEIEMGSRQIFLFYFILFENWNLCETPLGHLFSTLVHRCPFLFLFPLNLWAPVFYLWATTCVSLKKSSGNKEFYFISGTGDLFSNLVQ